MTTMSKSESINELADALSKAQGEFLPAKMNAVNPFLKNHYADLGSVIEAAKVACLKNGLAVSQPASADNGFVTVTTLLMHTSGQWLSSDMSLPLGAETKNIAQAAGSIITYLRRYSLSATLGIYADEDTDGEKVSEKKVVKDEQSNDGHKSEKSSETANPYKKFNVTLEQAKLVTGSDGVKYGDVDDKDLKGKRIGIVRKLGIPNITPEERDELLYKVEAIDVLREAIAKQSAIQAG